MSDINGKKPWVMTRYVSIYRRPFVVRLFGRRWAWRKPK